MKTYDKEKKHTVYGILYYDIFRQCSVASVAADSDYEALNLLEKKLTKREQTINRNLNPEIIATKYKTLKKGLYPKFDSCWLFPYLLRKAG
jgi:hypothetical protein